MKVYSIRDEDGREIAKVGGKSATTILTEAYGCWDSYTGRRRFVIDRACEYTIDVPMGGIQITLWKDFTLTEIK